MYLALQGYKALFGPLLRIDMPKQESILMQVCKGNMNNEYIHTSAATRSGKTENIY